VDFRPGGAAAQPLIQDDDRAYVKGLFDSMLKREVDVVLFVSAIDCKFCGQAKDLLRELASLNPLIRLEVLDLERDKQRSQELAIDQAPTTVVLANNGARLYFLGLPSGYELRALAEDIVDASLEDTGMSDFAKAAVAGVSKPMTVDVFVTPTSPYAAIVVRAAHRLALENLNIRSRMVEIMEFPDMALKYNVIGVPKILIDEKIEYDGTLAEEALAELLQAAAQ